MIPGFGHEIADPFPPVTIPDLMIVPASQRMQDNCQVARNPQYFLSGPYTALQTDQQRSFWADGRELEARLSEPFLPEQSADRRSDKPLPMRQCCERISGDGICEIDPLWM